MGQTGLLTACALADDIPLSRCGLGHHTCPVGLEGGPLGPSLAEVKSHPAPPGPTLKSGAVRPDYGAGLLGCQAPAGPAAAEIGGFGDSQPNLLICQAYTWWEGGEEKGISSSTNIKKKS